MAVFTTEQKNNLQRFTQNLAKMVPNRQLLNRFYSDLERIITHEGELITATENDVEYRFADGDSFSISIGSFSIVANYNFMNIKSLEKIELSNLGRYVFFNYDVVNGNRREEPLPVNMKRSSVTKTYFDDEVIYEREYVTNVVSDLTNNDCTTKERVVHVNSNRIAYIRDVLVSNEHLDKPRVTYSKCYSYNPEPFNNLVNREMRVEPHIVPSNENEFETWNSTGPKMGI